MKKRIISLVLIIALCLGMAAVITGCVESDLTLNSASSGERPGKTDGNDSQHNSSGYEVGGADKEPSPASEPSTARSSLIPIPVPADMEYEYFKFQVKEWQIVTRDEITIIRTLGTISEGVASLGQQVTVTSSSGRVFTAMICSISLSPDYNDYMISTTAGDNVNIGLIEGNLTELSKGDIIIGMT